MTKIYLIRHAEAEGNLYRRIQGHYNSLITENGHLQIAALRERFRDIHIDAVYSSDLYRTMTTATAIYEAKGLPLHTDPELREVNMGTWEDQTWGEVGLTDGKNLLLFMDASPLWKAPEGETYQEVGDRVIAAICRIAAQHPNQTIAIFSHGCAIRQVALQVQNYPSDHWNDIRHGENTAVTTLTYDEGNLTVEEYASASHITHEVSTLGRQTWWKKDKEARRELVLCFRPLNWETEADLYLSARREAWETTHGKDIPFDGDKFLADAGHCAQQGPWGLQVATNIEGEVQGILQLDMTRYGGEGCGYIAFFYLFPKLRGLNLGIQLLGAAISTFRKEGATALRLRCAPYNEVAQNFYKKHGFAKIGDEENSPVPLEILEKYIGFDRQGGAK